MSNTTEAIRDHGGERMSDIETKERPVPRFEARSWNRIGVFVGLLILIAIAQLPFFLIGSSLRIAPAWLTSGLTGS